MAIDHDGLFKELLTTFFREFLDLFAPRVFEYGKPTSLTLAGTETVRDSHETGARRADLVVKVDFRGGEQTFFLIHVEVQAQTQTEFAKRMFHYFARLHQMYDALVYPIALLAFDARTRDEPDEFTVTFPDRNVLRFEFLKIYLRKLDWREFLGSNNPVAAALMAKMGYTKAERARVKVECLRVLATLRLEPDKTRLIGRFIEAYLTLDESELHEYNEIMEAIPMAEKQGVTDILTYWEKLGLEKGRQQGLEQGLRQGLTEGQLKGMQTMVLALIESRFGPVSAPDRDALQRLSPEELQRLGLSVGGAASYDELRSHLRANGV